MKSIKTCLMFVGEQAGRAEEAIRLYTSLFANSHIDSIERVDDAQEASNIEEFKRAHSTLSENGIELMPPDDYGFSQQFCWLNDQYGVSWQLNYANESIRS